MENHEIHPLIDRILSDYKESIGVDFERYSNHVKRVYLFTQALDNDQRNADKYAIAAVFHDIGIWTDHTIDYLEPSIAVTHQYLDQNQLSDWKKEIGLMIDMHHKINSYEGDFQNTVSTFRKADWIDVSLGMLRFGVGKKRVKEVRKSIPNAGFHWFLTKGTFTNFLKHPLNPLPMFRK